MPTEGNDFECVSIGGGTPEPKEDACLSHANSGAGFKFHFDSMRPDPSATKEIDRLSLHERLADERTCVNNELQAQDVIISSEPPGNHGSDHELHRAKHEVSKTALAQGC